MDRVDPSNEVVICIWPAPFDLLPRVDLVIIGEGLTGVAATVQQRYEIWLAHCTDHGASTRHGSTYRVLYVVVSAEDAAASARAYQRLAAARRGETALIVLAVLGDELGKATAVAPLCDATLLSEHQEGLLHLLKLMLPTGSTAIGYDLADVLSIWRGGVGQVVLAARQDDPAPVFDALHTLSGVSILLEDDVLTRGGLLDIDRMADGLRPVLPQGAALLHAYNQRTTPYPAFEIGMVRPIAALFHENGPC